MRIMDGGGCSGLAGQKPGPARLGALDLGCRDGKASPMAACMDDEDAQQHEGIRKNKKNL